MPYMCLCHYETLVTYPCAALRGYATIYDDLLTDNIVVTYIAEGALAFPPEILGIGAHYSTLIHFVVAPHAGAAYH